METTNSSSSWFAAEYNRVFHRSPATTESQTADIPEGWKDLSKASNMLDFSSVVLDKLTQLREKADSREGQMGIKPLHVQAARLDAIAEANNISRERLNELVGGNVSKDLHQRIQSHLKTRVTISLHETSVQAPLRAVWNIGEIFVRIINFLTCTAGANKVKRAEKNGNEIVRCFRIIGQSLLQAIPFYGNSVMGGSKK